MGKFHLLHEDPSSGEVAFGAFADQTRAPDPSNLEALRRQLADERARGLRLEAELAEAAADLEETRRELLALEEALRPNPATDAADERRRQLRGVRVLYVGGRPRLIEQLRTMVAARGGDLLAHDGGVEDNPALLPGLVAQADAVFFPVDGVGRVAAERLKRLCRRLAKPWRSLRSASLASFVAQIAAGGAASTSPRVEAAE